jgi:hypothetical protein
MRVENDDFEDLFVTLYDTNTATPRLVLDQYRLNRGASVQVNLQPSGQSYYNARWTARRTDGSRQNDGTFSGGPGDIIYVKT